ncbi:hypothetical protein KL86DES1_21084 [uncultured Desulfovibrio sp.]|uniref:Uncharacterized protein n=1 Tax=uncultured Desulfovibrio sp. TaxID=167968 RepID=A0A212L6L0_9BACT|nr:hypothetical protein KL86DES1_21084 [uncultured Desulfovibrio sp.]VZH33983.1 conserved protein of unknown function [Desulfovibrio sp. 86]
MRGRLRARRGVSMRDGRSEEIKARACPLRISFCALRAWRPVFYYVWAASAGDVSRVCATGALKKLKQGLSSENKLLCPAGMAAFLLLRLGRLRRGQKGPVKGAAPPDEAPSALPPFTPKAFQLPQIGEGCAAFAPGASSLRSAISLRAAQCQRAPSR